MESAVPDGNSASAPAAPAPTSFAQVYASAESSPAESPAQSSTPAVAEVPPTDQGAAPAEGGDERSPFIPRPRFDEVNTERNALKQWKEQYAWAESVNRDQLDQAVRLAQRYQGDPIGFLQELASEVQAHPDHGPKLKSWAAAQLARRSSAPAADDMPTPDVAITNDSGQVVGHTYSDKALQARDAWLTRQVLSQVKQEFAPVAKTVAEVQAERDARDKQQRIESFASSTFEDVQTWPGMASDANRKAVAAELAKAQINSDDEREVALALNAAYRKVVLPTLGSKAESTLLDTLQKKAAASTSVNPGSAAPSAPADIRSFTDPRLQWS